MLFIFWRIKQILWKHAMTLTLYSFKDKFEWTCRFSQQYANHCLRYIFPIVVFQVLRNIVLVPLDILTLHSIRLQDFKWGNEMLTSWGWDRSERNYAPSARPGESLQSHACHISLGAVLLMSYSPEILQTWSCQMDSYKLHQRILDEHASIDWTIQVQWNPNEQPRTH